MSTKINIIMATSLAILITTMPSNTYAGGPFSNPNKLGDVMMVMSPAFALGMAAMADDWVGSTQLAKSIISAQIASEGLKSLKLERRPSGTDKKSLPSGHAAGAFSGAMYVHRRYGWKPALIPYTMSFVAGWSRVHARAHYWHDVAAGAAISALFTWCFVDKYLPEDLDVSVEPGNVHMGFKTKF